MRYKSPWDKVKKKIAKITGQTLQIYLDQVYQKKESRPKQSPMAGSGCGPMLRKEQTGIRQVI